MATGDGRHRQDSHEIFDLPVRRDERAASEDDHAGDTEQGEGHAELELLEHFGHFDEEIGELGFFGGGTPGHVDFEHVGEERGRDMEREPAEEDSEHENPFEVFKN